MIRFSPVPGSDPMLPDDASPEDIAPVRAAFGLEIPPPVHYGLCLRSAVQGNFGRSIKGQVPVLDNEPSGS
jgi:peptide/nickel transport system permease protein